MNGATGTPGHPGMVYADTTWGRYSIPEAWADAVVFDLVQLGNFLVSGPGAGARVAAYVHALLRLMHRLADQPAGLALFAEEFPRELAAYQLWRQLGAPTMGSLLAALNQEGRE